jgi:transposase-like protein
MPTQSPYRIEPTDDERAILDERARAHTAPYWEVVRARIVLLAAEGLANKEIAARLDTTPQTVCKWRKRFYEEGLGGLEDRPRSGRPPTFSPRDEDRAEGFGLRASGQQRGPVEPLECRGGGSGGS